MQFSRRTPRSSRLQCDESPEPELRGSGSGTSTGWVDCCSKARQSHSTPEAHTGRNAEAHRASPPAHQAIDAVAYLETGTDAAKFKDYILPLIFLKRLSNVFDDEVERLKPSWTLTPGGGARHARPGLRISAEEVSRKTAARVPVSSTPGARSRSSWPTSSSRNREYTSTTRAAARAGSSSSAICACWRLTLPGGTDVTRLPTDVAPVQLFGQEINPATFAIARMNAVIHDLKPTSGLATRCASRLSKTARANCRPSKPWSPIPCGTKTSPPTFKTTTLTSASA